MKLSRKQIRDIVGSDDQQAIKALERALSGAHVFPVGYIYVSDAREELTPEKMKFEGVWENVAHLNVNPVQEGGDVWYLLFWKRIK